MNNEDVIRMAREAGCIPRRHPEYDNDIQVFATPDVLERFAALVAAAKCNPLYTAPKQWVGLTDEEHDSIKHNYHNMTWTLEMFARAIEQALKEKNHG